MATLILSSNKAESRGGFISVHLNIGGTEPDPMPRREVAIKNVKDAQAALDAYRAEAVATGKPMVISARLRRGERAPNGFNAWSSGSMSKPEFRVNL